VGGAHKRECRAISAFKCLPKGREGGRLRDRRRRRDGDWSKTGCCCYRSFDCRRAGYRRTRRSIMRTLPPVYLVTFKNQFLLRIFLWLCQFPAKIQKLVNSSDGSRTRKGLTTVLAICNYLFVRDPFREEVTSS